MPKAIHMQVDKYIEYCRLVRRMSEKTIREKMIVYRNFISMTGITKLQKLDNEIFNEYISQLAKRDLKPSSINTNISSVVSLIRYHREMGLNMPIKIPLISKQRVGSYRHTCYTRDEIMTVIKNTKDPMTRLMIKILFDTGLRIAELQKLRISNFNGCHIRFIGKGRKDREVYIKEDTANELQSWIECMGVQNYIWENRNTKLPYSTSSLRNRMRRAFKASGYTDFYPHAIRHSFGSDIQKRGADLFIIQKMMGHNNLAATQHYLHSLDGRLENLFADYR